MSELMRSLVIDNWYKALLVISAGLLVLALTVPMQIPNRVVLVGALGGLLHALGQWINHPYQERIGQGFKVSGHVRRTSFGGTALELGGLGLLGWAAWLLVRA
mgnify:CR=1 FL=1